MALLELKNLTRIYRSGEEDVAVLKGVNLDINRGEMVSIIGPSGSGKSTLMNILGLLDRPSGGTYEIDGKRTDELDSDALSALRREHFGFIFQRYNLLSDLTALGNVEVPAIYAGISPSDRRSRATKILERLGMGERLRHRPGQLSGGQQQRVSIARALINGGEVILADEPTGALDKHSGEEVLRILDELHAEGRTIIIVTHDPGVAARAERVIEIADGEIIADRRQDKPVLVRENTLPSTARPHRFPGLDRLGEAFMMAVRALASHRLRTFLTMLGIIIGIASVVSVVALGAGTQQKVLSNINGLGTNTLEIFPGKGFGDTRSGKITTLKVGDADALARLSYVSAVTPTVSTSGTVRYGATVANVLVNGVGDQYFTAKGSKLLAGRLFDHSSVVAMTQEAVIDQNAAKALFGDDPAMALGHTVFLTDVPVRIVGVIEAQQGGFGSNSNLQAYLPYSSVQARFLGDLSLRSITVRLDDSVDSSVAESAVTTFLAGRHGEQDFFILNTDDIRKTIVSTAQTLTLLVAAIAVISLIVGGIGVMNIMLVSVSERVSEIGVRMAVGARRQDILQQFLIEAVLVCLIGGGLGIGFALSIGFVFSMLVKDFQLVYSTTSMVAAFSCSCLIGLIFGFMPARNASRLDPVAALSKD
ncbi:MacB family efflux pump subunit [Agrobacterium vitis]|uniref:MacB family efflux pump subunit n=1 Tax=Agrobacterium vitis TaxID=373 RepID=UPI0015DBC324|nr:MacB family efflux pump subunit [Agrobacterium vitis]MCF1451305.1 MacB family efflux pump subunit [Agrobacterium vitis]BCH53690.1 macrolide export ATP-binding/permease protein MacB [Agrobacterium vitis]